MSEDLNKSLSINNTIDQYLANYPDKFTEDTTWWENESNSEETSENSEETDPEFPSDEFEKLLITPNEYYSNLTGEISNNLTTYTSNAEIPSSETIIESKKPIYFWVPTLRNWCRYYSCKDYTVENFKNNPFGNSFIYLTQWNGKNGWIPFVSLTSLNKFTWITNTSSKFNYYKYGKLKNKNYYLNRKIISNISGKYHWPEGDSNWSKGNNLLFNCLDRLFFIKFSENIFQIKI